MFNGKIGDILKQAQQLQENLKTKQEELAKRQVEVSVGGGLVKMVFNGKSEAVSIAIDKEVVDPADLDTLQDLVLSAVNMGVRQSQQLMQDELAKLTGGMKIPGFGP